MSLIELKKEVKKNSRKSRANKNKRFFKTGTGEYAEGDKFLGLVMRDQRLIAKKYQNLSFNELKKLLKSSYHEERMIGLLILVYKYENRTSTDRDKKQIFDFYIKERKAINNWDLVDVTTPNIVGEYLKDKTDRKILYTLARSRDLWQKRISILATLRFIKEKDFKDTINISVILLKDKHDLIHKAVGWMLREMGKKDKKDLKKFLDEYAKEMPRTMLRYSLEKFGENEREHYMK